MVDNDKVCGGGSGGGDSVGGSRNVAIKKKLACYLDWRANSLPQLQKVIYFIRRVLYMFFFLLVSFEAPEYMANKSDFALSCLFVSPSTLQAATDVVKYRSESREDKKKWHDNEMRQIRQKFLKHSVRIFKMIFEKNDTSFRANKCDSHYKNLVMKQRLNN